MDIRCPLCGEPWEIDSLHEQVAEEHPDKPWYVDDKPEDYGSEWFNKEKGQWYSQRLYEPYFQAMRKRFSVEGCAVFNVAHGPISKKNSIFGELMELAGDDIDFAASMIEDAERMGLID